MPLDSQNMLQVIKDFPKQCREALELPKGIAVSKMKNIVVAGMGGSAIGGDLLKTCLSATNMPVQVVRDYHVGPWVNEETLVFAVSYSGNTEETLAAAQDAKDKNAKVIGITSGGKLKDMCDTVITIPSGLQPRAALGYLFFPMLGIVHNSGFVRVKNEELNEMLSIIKEADDFSDEGEKLAKQVKDKIPIVYASQKLMPVAMRWKTQINENAKLPAFYNVFSEMNHNEIAAVQGMDRKYIALLIRDKDDHPQIQKRMDVCKEIMEERIEVAEVQTQGNGLLAKLFSTIYLGDFFSYYLALWKRVDPSPVDVIEGMKRKLRE